MNGCEEDVIPLKEILMTRSQVLELALREVLSILSKFTEPEDSTKKASLPWSHSPLHERWRRTRRKAPWFRKHLWL